MALSRSTAKEIIDIVSHDTKSTESISSVFSYFGSIAGSVRNAAMVGADLPANLVNFLGLETTKNFPEGTWNREKWICSGIAKLTTEAINKAVLIQKKLPKVRFAREIKRTGGNDHYATQLVMRDGSDYIFDWHATLNVRNPRIYRVRNWHSALTGSGYTYENFMGFK